MKILKIKLGLFSLLAILAVSVFLTSCEQEEINIAEDTLVTDNLLELPNDFDPESDDLFNYLESLGIDITDTQQNEIESRGCGSFSQAGGCWIRRLCYFLNSRPFYHYKNPCSGQAYIVWL